MFFFFQNVWLNWNTFPSQQSGFTPLHIAAHYGNNNVAKLLVQRNADVNFKAKVWIIPCWVVSFTTSICGCIKSFVFLSSSGSNFLFLMENHQIKIRKVHLKILIVFLLFRSTLGSFQHIKMCIHFARTLSMYNNTTRCSSACLRQKRGSINFLKI